MLVSLLLLLPQGGFELPGGVHWDGHGRTAFFLSDVTGDGVPEIGTSAFCQDSGGFNSGAVYVYDGATRAVLRRHTGPGCNVRLGEAAAVVGDLDGDGHPEYASGARYTNFAAPHCGSLYVWSGATGAEWLRLDGAAADEEFGAAVAAVGDLDGDGVNELLVGAPGAVLGRGLVRIHSGRTGALLRTHTGSLSRGALGRAVAGLDDLDGDGVADYALAAPGALQDAGAVIVHSGSDGREIGTRTGGGPGRFLGAALLAPGDCDGDGLPELLIGEPGGDAVHLHSPAGDRLLRTHTLPPALRGRGFGLALGGCGDVDGDGRADYLLGLPGRWRGVEFLAAGGPALAVSGASGAPRQVFPATGPDDAFGMALQGGADLDGDGRPDFLIGAPAWGDRLGGAAPGALCVRFGS